jgi:cytochrome P450
MLHPVRSLSPEQRLAVESLLGHPVSDGEAVSIKSIRTTPLLERELSAEERRAAVDRLDRYFAKVDAQRKPVSEAEAEAIIDEALRSTRPDYRPRT